MGRWQQCQSPQWNPKYHMESGSCQTEGHHTHYYCRYCRYNFNPFGWWKKPTEADPCRCQDVNNSDSDDYSLSDPDEPFYEEPWDPRYRPERNRPDTPSEASSRASTNLSDYLEEEVAWQDQASEIYSLAPSITVVTADRTNPWNESLPEDYAWWEASLRNDIWWQEPKMVRKDD